MHYKTEIKLCVTGTVVIGRQIRPQKNETNNSDTLSYNI